MLSNTKSNQRMHVAHTTGLMFNGEEYWSCLFPFLKVMTFPMWMSRLFLRFFTTCVTASCVNIFAPSLLCLGSYCRKTQLSSKLSLMRQYIRSCSLKRSVWEISFFCSNYRLQHTGVGVQSHD